MLGVLFRLLDDPASRAGIDRLIVRNLRGRRQRAGVHLLSDDDSWERALTRVGASLRYTVRGRRGQAAYGLVFPKAVMAAHGA
jgi:hypothetical protein